MIRLFASDLDGTLLDGYRQISQENIDAIHRLQNDGVEFIFNTGREYQNVQDIMADFDLSIDVICTNGSCCYDKEGKLLFEESIPTDTLNQIFDIYEDMGMYPTLFSRDGRVTLQSRQDFHDYLTGTIFPAIQVAHPNYDFDESSATEILDEAIYVANRQELFDQGHTILKCVANSLDPEEIITLRNRVEAIPGLAAVSTSTTDLEITSDKAQKGNALLHYAKLRGIQENEILAIGDSENDYSMLSLPEVESVAMDNAAPMVKEVCHYITRANTKDGVAYIIRCLMANRDNFKLF